MIKAFLTATTAAVSIFSIASAQQPSPKSQTMTPDSITVTGCIAESMGHYMLTHALRLKPVATPVPSAAAEPAQNAPADDQTYELIGSQVKAHVGHRVEVTGRLPPAPESGNAQASADPARTAHPIAGTVNVRTVKMLDSSCP